MRNDEDFLIRLDSATVQFPGFCPICRKSAERKGLVSKVVRGHFRSSMGFLPMHHRARGLTTKPNHLRRSIHVPVCEEHFLSTRFKEKLRPTCVIVNGVSIVTTIFLGLLIIASSLDRFMIGVQWFLFLELSVIIAVTSLVWLRPTELERAISIIRIEPGTTEIVLRLRHKWYLDDLLRLNPCTSRRVKITKIAPDSI